MGIHLCPCPPSHEAALRTPSRLLSRSSLFLRRPMPELKMTTAAGPAASLRLVSRCAAYQQPCEPNPEDDLTIRRFRKKMASGLAAGRCSSQDATEAELRIILFREERDKLEAYRHEIASNHNIFHKDGRGLALMLCLSVAMVIHLASRITANACVRVIESSGISSNTVQQMIRTYLSTFLKIVEDTCHSKADRSHIISFIDALRGLAAISHILIQDAMIAVNNVKDCSPKYIPEHDAERLNHELQCNMKELETRFTSASDNEVYELLWSTLSEATNHVSLFVIQMTNLRKKAVMHIQEQIKDKDDVAIDDKHTNNQERDA